MPLLSIFPTVNVDDVASSTGTLLVPAMNVITPLITIAVGGFLAVIVFVVLFRIILK